jgi:hypothetical protein
MASSKRKGVQDCTAAVLAAVAAERQKREEVKLAEAEQAITQGDREPWTPDLLHHIAGMGVDVAALVERYRERTAGRGIDDPNAYLLAMAKEAVAKRIGTTREFVAAISNDRAAMASTVVGDGMRDTAARAQATRREELARQLGGGDMAKGYAALAMIPDRPHRRRRGQDRSAGASQPGAGPSQPTGLVPLGAVLPAGLSGATVVATGSAGG